MRNLLSTSVGGLAAVCAAASLAATSPATGATAAQAAAPRLCDGHRATIVGTPGKDRIRGTNRRDVIVSLGGNDTVRARGGHDIVCTGKGADLLVGGPGRDRLFGGQDMHGRNGGGLWQIGDTLRGGPGNDHLDPGYDAPGRAVVENPDVIDYRWAARRIVADLRTRTVTGEGRDFYAGAGPFGVRGSAHADTFRGSRRADYLIGLAGDDVIHGNGGNDEIHADTVFEGGVRRGDDVVHGGGGADYLTSWAGHDVIHGEAGADSITAESRRSSKVYGGAGNDSVTQYAVREVGVVSVPGPGDDSVRFDAAVADPVRESRMWTRVNLRTGVIRLGQGPEGRVGAWETTTFYSLTKVRFRGTEASERVEANHDATLHALTFGGDDVVFGSIRADHIDAGDGNDRIAAGAGRDTCLNAERVTSCEQ